jgi:hypothetical protein
MRSASLSLLTILCLLLAVAPAVADTLYSNGPINGTTDAWTINMQDGYSFSVTDSFTCFFGCRVAGLHIGVWLLPGDTVTSVQMDIGTSSFGTDKFSGVLTAAGSTDLGINQYGVDIQQIDFEVFPYIDLVGADRYWLTLSNAVAPSGDTIYWDENSGPGCQSWGCPSTAYQTINGSIPSEAFTITGDRSYGYTPEPSSIHAVRIWPRRPRWHSAPEAEHLILLRNNPY